ncbi:hypothetical protein AURDEDRAFT_161327 [Auricularia subglabra TFB-10046 SS5]|nr:hypothetical protein AURDEDRAFT_161327 [Auricularia subglabra TFB-10046 SS5]
MFFLPAAIVALASSHVALAAPTAEKSKRADISSLPSIFSQLHAFETSPQVVSLTNNAIPPFAFNNWGGVSALSNFDNFFGVGNFDGRFNQLQHITVVQQSVEVIQVQQVQVLQCSVVDLRIVQQNLAILIESMKQILLTQVCEVEAQIILASQFGSRWNVFIDDIRRISGRNIGFDAVIAAHLQSVLGSIGGNHVNLGFGGSSIGSHLQFVNSNWNPTISPARAHSAWVAGQLAVLPPSVIGL